MKHAHSFFTPFLLFFSLLLWPSEYHHSSSYIPHMVVDFDFAQSRTNTITHPYFRTHHTSNIIRQQMRSNAQNQRTTTNTASVSNVETSTFDNKILSSEMRAYRNKIFKLFMDNHPERHTYCCEKYTISPLDQNYLNAHNIQISSLESCTGSMLQRILHQEFLVLTDATAHLWNQKYAKEIKDLTTVISDFIDAGICFNHEQEVKKASALADAGWALFDCILAAGEGIIEGIGAVAHDITHPIQTIQNIANAAISCGYYLGVALQEIGITTKDLLLGNFDAAYSKYELWSEQCKIISQALYECSKELSTHDAIKTASYSFIQCYATTRAINGFGSLFNTAHCRALNIAKKVSEGAQESTSLMSVQGIPLRIAQETTKQIKNLPRAQDKLFQVLQHFNGQIIRVGKITCLLDKKGLKHILERHHPNYWNGSFATTQTFLNKKTGITDIVDIIKQVIKQNRKIILDKGNVGKYQIEGTIKNTKYIVGFDNGRIGQFYIPLKQ